MKQFIFPFLTTIFFFVSFSSIAKAQDIPGDDGEVIVVSADEVNQSIGLGRSISIVPFSVTLFRSLSYIEVEFYDNLGEMTITLTNLTTGCSTNIMVDSSNRIINIPFISSSGLWKLTLCTEEGVSYSGSFIIP